MPPPLLALRDAAIRLGTDPLFAGVTAQVGRGDRICLVGRNGSGKSTLLRALAGDLELDAGELFLQPGTTVSYLPQEPVFAPAAPAVEVVAEGAPAHLDPAEAHHRALRVLDKAAVDPSAPVGSLSGGETRRVALARALAAEAEVLLLDEPTNHLDITTIERLEDELSSFAGAIVVVSHDRAFLRRLSRRTWWLDRGQLRQNDAGFASFEEWTEQVLAAEEAASDRLDKRIRQETEWLRYGVTARRKRNQGRLRRLGEMRASRAAQIRPEGRVRFDGVQSGQGAKVVIEARGVSKSFAGDPLVAGFSTRILRGDRVGLVGPNGAGKTTLLRLLTGQLAPDAGDVKSAQGLRFGFVDQRRETLQPDATPWSTLCPEGGDQVMVQGRWRHVVGYLEDFLFRPHQARAPVRSLSGGERNRLLLARQLAEPADLLVLDEPTNDLDVETLDLLQEVLSDFAGTLLLVSHDRDFLDRLVTSVIAFEGRGRLVEYAGGYSDMLRQRPPAEEGTPRPVKAMATPAKKSRTTGSDRPKRDLERVVATIERLEALIRTLEEELSDSSLFLSDPAGFATRSKRLELTRDELEAAERRWLELEERLAAG
jgi:ATP-binding cassette subfamily F protein uup